MNGFDQEINCGNSVAHHVMVWAVVMMLDPVTSLLDNGLAKYARVLDSNLKRTRTVSNEERPYILEQVTTTVYKYNPNYGDDRVCQCGHRYYRHFDTYENMSNVGCKYCWCHDFQEADLSEENIDRMCRAVGEYDLLQYQELLSDFEQGRRDPRFLERLMELHFGLSV